MRIRHLKIKPDSINDKTKLSTIDSAAVTLFEGLKKDETIKQFFIEGYTYEEIANWAEKQGILTVDKETFKRYLSSYRRIRRAFFDDITDKSTFGAIAGVDVPIDEHKNFVLMKLRAALRVMEKRLAVATNNELNVNMLMDNTNKDFRVYLDMLGAYDKALKSGSISGQAASDVSDILGETNAFAMEDRINKEREAQNRISSLVQDLVKVKK